MAKAPVSKNQLLASLSAPDLALLQPQLQQVDLPVRRFLEHRNRKIESVFFIETGFASVVANGGAKRSIEVGIIGSEGFTGISLLLGAERAPHDVYMQSAGSGMQIAAGDLLEAVEKSRALRHRLLNFAHIFAIQTAHTALANGRCKIEERLARWLLMAHDRLGDQEMELTHEFLSLMLGVRRPGVTVAIQALERRGLIENRRGLIAIIDREGLKKCSNGAYGAPEAEMRRLLS